MRANVVDDMGDQSLKYLRIPQDWEDVQKDDSLCNISVRVDSKQILLCLGHLLGKIGMGRQTTLNEIDVRHGEEEEE